MVGYPGSGKTTVSNIIQKLTGAEHLWADHERRQMFTRPTYKHEENLKLYAMLNQKAKQLLHQGRSVIFDTNFNFYKDREKMRRIAAGEGAKTVLIWITTKKDIARERATVHPLEGEHHRVLGNMPIKEFNRIARNLQPPRPEEHAIQLEGVDLNEQVIAAALGLL